MLGLMYIGALLAYLLLALLLAWFGARLARRSGMAGWKAGLPVFAVLMLLVFWDWLPMEIMFRYDCSNRAGFTQYKTLEQWKQENLGVAETLQPYTDVKSTHEGNRERYLLNQRFAWDVIRTNHSLHIREREELIVDTMTDEVLARYVDFDTDIPPTAMGGKGDGAYKVWMMKRSCESGNKVRTKPNKFMFNKFMYLVQYQEVYGE